MIIQGYYPLVGGAERILAATTPLLCAQRVEVHILTRRYPGLAPFEMIQGVPVHRLPIPGPKAMASLTFTLFALPLLRRLRPDIIHAHELFSPTTTAVAAKQLLGTPVVATAHRSGFIGDVQRLKRKAFGEQRLAYFRTHVDRFVVISQEIDRELAGVGVPPEHRCFIPNGVDTKRFRPLSFEEKRSLRNSLGLPEDALITIFTGRLAPEKRVDQLLTIWPAVRSMHPKALLLLLGTGSEEAALRRAAGVGVQFAGRVEEVAPYLQAADLFVLPSAAEGLSVALLEALAAGLPVVATAVGGAPDVIEHNKHGWLIPPDDSTALQEAVLTLLHDPARRSDLGQQARERMTQEYALPIIAEQLRALYIRLAGSVN
jgi:glycosyltransferase involved in cell wall biosynthesis